MKKSLPIVRLLTIFAFLISGQALAQPCTVTITGDNVVCPGDQTTLTALANGPDVQLMASNTAGNNHRGNMFDITATNTVTILSFDASPMGNTTIEIYYKVGTWNGSANTPSDWTFIGSAPTPYTGGFSAVAVPVNVTIPAGQTYAFYVTSNTTSVSLNYSNGTGVGNVYSSDANITFREGGGLEYPFTQGTGAVYQPRVWNGNIHYAVANAGTTYVWSTSATTTSIQPTINTPTQFSVESTSPGCPTMYDTVNVITSIPTINAGNDVTLCSGDTVLLHATGNAQSYAWDNGVTDSVSFVPSSSVTYIATATDSIGCTNTDTVYVAVNSLPTVFAGSDFAICNSDSITLSGQGAVNYTWDNSVVDGVSFTPSASNAYIVTGTDANGCVNSDTIDVTVNALPIVDAGQDQQLCFGSQTVLMGSGAVNYMWNNGIMDGMPFTPVAGTTEYIVTGMDVNGCLDQDTVSLTVTQIDAPIAVNGTVLVTALNPGGTYQWYNCDSNQIIPGETGFSYIPTTTGNYAVIVVTADQCQDTSDCMFIDFTGISENAIGTFNAFPNPTKGNITVNSSSVTIDKVEVLDLLGNVLYTEEIGLLSTTIDLSSFEGKQFLIRVISENKSEVMKVLKF